MIDTSTLQYLTGFGNEHESEALPGALPIGRFNPQKCSYDLYTEQFSTTAFTAPRHQNRRSWLYRIRPSIAMGDYSPIDKGMIRTAPNAETVCPPNNMRWTAPTLPTSKTDFISGIKTLAVNGDATMQIGIGIHTYSANANMEGSYFYNADGELLIVPQMGDLLIYTEMGILHFAPGEIAVIPRGIKFKVELPSGQARGYICENYGAALDLPERGPVGSDGFANDRDFQYPTAWFEDIDGDFTLISKFCGNLYSAALDHSPLDVVAWVGNTAPYKYDLARFNTINSVSFDHPDPSIFTVLTSQSDTPGVANIDFVVFPPRWMVSEDTFRPPWFHRNIMSEAMGLIEGVYDAKDEGFEPGGMSLHNCMTPHGPDASAFDSGISSDLEPERYKDTLAFMFESRYVIQPTQYAMTSPTKDKRYLDCWAGLKKYFNGKK